MEQTKQNIIAGIIIILASLGITATPGILTNELADYYICDKTDEISEFKGGVSKTTGYSGYPFIDSRKGPVYCGTSDNKGTWISLSQYAEDNDLDVYELILAEMEEGEQEEPEPEEKPVNPIVPNPSHGSKKEICHPGADICIPI